MSARAPLVLTGPQAVRVTNQLAKVQDRRDQWPYPWLFPPPNATRVTVGQDASGTLAAPVPATLSTVLQYQVQSGFQFWLTSIVQVYLGSGFISGSGDILWYLDRNSPVGTPIPQGSPVQGYTAVDVPLGSLLRPWEFDVPELFQPYDVIRSKVIVTAAIPTGAPNYFKTIFRGWTAPASEV